MNPQRPTVAIVDFGLGNLFSVQNACTYVGLQAVITSKANEILSADAVLLPGVGAFGDAMATLNRLDLVTVLRDVASSNKPLMGICLGIQLLMTESCEFGQHKGLGLIDGEVVRFNELDRDGHMLKVPNTGWGQISDAKSWTGTILEGVPTNCYMYFVHSFLVLPQNSSCVLSYSKYGDIEFCSSLQSGNIFACQFHPERSGQHGLTLYRNLARQINR